MSSPKPGERMRRREFLGVLGGAAAGWPLAARAQQPGGMRRIAVLMGAAPTELGEVHLTAFLRRLDDLGWKKDRSARIEVRAGIAGETERPRVGQSLDKDIIPARCRHNRVVPRGGIHLADDVEQWVIPFMFATEA